MDIVVVPFFAVAKVPSLRQNNSQDNKSIVIKIQQERDGLVPGVMVQFLYMKNAAFLGLFAIAVFIGHLCASGASVAALSTQSSITKDSITWTFSQAVPVGQFVNGDYYVVGPVTVTSISPAPQTVRAVRERIGAQPADRGREKRF